MKCYLCNKKAIGRYTVDLDIPGVPFCKEHKAEVFVTLFVMMQEQGSQRRKDENHDSE